MSLGKPTALPHSRLSIAISDCCSRDHSIPQRSFPIGGPLDPSPLTVSEIFNGECDAYGLSTKVAVIHFSTNRFLIIRLPIGCQ